VELGFCSEPSLKREHNAKRKIRRSAVIENPSPAKIADAFAELLGLASPANDGADLRKVEKLAAAIDAANYLNANMFGCTRYGDSTAILTAGMEARSVENGLILEFGVYSGRTINHIASLDVGKVFGFDSFDGLPEDWRPDFTKGAFRRTDLPQVAQDVTLVPGWFEDSLPAFLKANPGPVSFLHIDCDLYSSTRTVLHYLNERIVPGTVIVFDEYFNYVGWRNHEFKAFAEFVAASKLSYRYFGAVPAHQQAGVLIV
jgi:hypothetical protein